MDIDAYSKAFFDFLTKIEQIKEPFSSEFQPALEEVCKVLEIEKVELLHYDDEESEASDIYNLLTLYQAGKESVLPVKRYRYVTSGGMIFVFCFYKNGDSVKWEQSECDKVDMLSNTLYAFTERIWLSKFAEKSVYYDSELMVMKVSYLREELAKIAQRGELQLYGVAFFNFKNFSAVNQAVGRDKGTKIMARCLAQLQQKMGNSGGVYRASGDNFTVLFKKKIQETVMAALEEMEVIYDSGDGASVILKTNVGIYLTKEDGTENGDIIENAYLAMQTARKNVDKSCVFYNDDIKAASEKSNKVENDFYDAILNEEFKVYYQPKVQLSDYSIIGAEALCRWSHDGEIISPNDFIPVLEQSNAICRLDFYMLERVCRDIRRWMDMKLKVVKISVNLSRRHMGDRRLLEKIISIIDKYQIPHSYIEIELTETTTDVGFNDLQTIVTGLHDNGIDTSVDDFGVGYSSLNLIRQVPWDVIKIDKSFLPEKFDRSSTQYILFSRLLSMFKELGLKCIVEGVETKEHVMMLRENECFMAQGFYFDKPLTVAEFETRLTKE